jgi:NAD-dependent SIR2 family protein deacetylase
MPHEFSFEEINSNEIFHVKKRDGNKVVYLHPGSIRNVACTLCKKQMSISMFEKHYKENIHKTSVRCPRWAEFLEWQERHNKQAEDALEEEIPTILPAEDEKVSNHLQLFVVFKSESESTF